MVDTCFEVLWALMCMVTNYTWVLKEKTRRLLIVATPLFTGHLLRTSHCTEFPVCVSFHWMLVTTQRQGTWWRSCFPLFMPGELRNLSRVTGHMMPGFELRNARLSIPKGSHPFCLWDVPLGLLLCVSFEIWSTYHKEPTKTLYA